MKYIKLISILVIICMIGSRLAKNRHKRIVENNDEKHRKVYVLDQLDDSNSVSHKSKDNSYVRSSKLPDFDYIEKESKLNHIKNGLKKQNFDDSDFIKEIPILDEKDSFKLKYAEYDKTHSLDKNGNEKTKKNPKKNKKTNIEGINSGDNINYDKILDTEDLKNDNKEKVVTGTLYDMITSKEFNEDLTNKDIELIKLEQSEDNESFKVTEEKKKKKKFH